MEYTAPAKINLYLKVLSKREDGYHEIETLFERISLSDRLFISRSTGPTKITSNDPAIPTDEESLMGKTVSLFNRKTGKDLKVKVVIEKNIPVGAGLGGGSSDAATLLKALNEISGFPLDKHGLISAAAELGSDVSFFLFDSSFAIGRGRGEVVQEVESALKICHILVNPPFQVSTKEVYSEAGHFALTNGTAVDKMFTAFLQRKDIDGIAKNLHNDLQEITLRKFPALAEVFSELEKNGAKGVLLSGSGPTVFGIFDHETALSARKNLLKVFPREKNWRVMTAMTY